MANPQPTRIWELDALRGFAVVGMVVYHFTFHLHYYTDIPIAPLRGGWLLLARATAVTFLSLVGVSLSLSRSLRPERAALHYLRRGGFIFGCGLLVTAATALFEPDAIVYFGVLHFIGVATVLAYPQSRRPLLAILLALPIFALSGWVRGLRVDTTWLIWLGLEPFGFRTLDYYPLFPHLGTVLVGVAVGHVVYPRGERRFAPPDLSNWGPVSGLSWLGRHSLIIFLVHQPLSVGLVLLLSSIR